MLRESFEKRIQERYYENTRWINLAQRRLSGEVFRRVYAWLRVCWAFAGGRQQSRLCERSLSGN